MSELVHRQGEYLRDLDKLMTSISDMSETFHKLDLNPMSQIHRSSAVLQLTSHMDKIKGLMMKINSVTKSI